MTTKANTTTTTTTCAACGRVIPAHKAGGVEAVDANGDVVTVCDSQCRIELSYDDENQDVDWEY